MSRLVEERKTLDALRTSRLDEHAGEFAVVVGTRLVGVFRDADQAFRAGVAAAPPDAPFLLEQLSPAHEPGVVLALITPPRR